MSDDTKTTKSTKKAASKNAKAKSANAAVIGQLSAAGFNGPQIVALCKVFKQA